jgi:hypothetical protein
VISRVAVDPAGHEENVGVASKLLAEALDWFLRQQSRESDRARARAHPVEELGAPLEDVVEQR